MAKEQVQVRLQFPIDVVHDYAERYAYAEDEQVIAIGKLASARGFYELVEFLVVCRWKTPRTGPLVRQNSASAVEAATREALSEKTEDAEVRIRPLLSLVGVAITTASVLLHLALPDRYPILDFRALEALGIRQPRAYSLEFWRSYVEAWRRALQASGVGGRTFDQALWQWSKGTRRVAQTGRSKQINRAAGVSSELAEL